MLKVVEGCEYQDYDYMDDDEARYQGYDTLEDSDFANGFTVTEPERKTEAREAPEKDNNEAESRVPGADDSTDDDDIWLDGDEDINENAEPDDEQMKDAPEEADDEEARYEDEGPEPGEKYPRSPT